MCSSLFIAALSMNAKKFSPDAHEWIKKNGKRGLKPIMVLQERDGLSVCSVTTLGTRGFAHNNNYYLLLLLIIVIIIKEPFAERTEG